MYLKKKKNLHFVPFFGKVDPLHEKRNKTKPDQKERSRRMKGAVLGVRTGWQMKGRWMWGGRGGGFKTKMKKRCEDDSLSLKSALDRAELLSHTGLNSDRDAAKAQKKERNLSQPGHQE